jgi:hypothetical protein
MSVTSSHFNAVVGKDSFGLCYTICFGIASTYFIRLSVSISFTLYNYHNFGHYLSSCLLFKKHDVLATGVCLRLQVEHTQIGPTEKLASRSGNRLTLSIGLI